MPENPDEMTMGEVGRTLKRLEDDIKTGMAGLSTQLTLMRGEFVPFRSFADRMAELDRIHSDVEARVRLLEATPTVTPKALWTGFVSAVAAGAALTPVLTHFTA